jgi:hypothetical protein
LFVAGFFSIWRDDSGEARDPLRDSRIPKSDPSLLDFFPSESPSLKASVGTPDAAAPAPAASDNKPPEVKLQRPVTEVRSLESEVPSLNLEVRHLNLNVTQAKKEVQDLEVTLGQLKTTAGELAENYRTLLQTYSAAEQRSQDIGTAFTRIDSLAQMRLTQLSNAGDLAARTEQMLARVESFSAETDRQLAAIADARKLLSFDLAQARAEARSSAHAFGVLRWSVARLHLPRVRLDTAIAAIHKMTARTSRRVAVAVALAVLAVVGIVATWPARNANGMEIPVLESRIVRAAAFQLPELPPGLTPMVPSVRQPPLRGRSSSSPSAANRTPTPAPGFIGQVAIQSSPPGASVFIDGKPVGETPMSSVRIRAGSHAIWIELPKYRRWTAAVNVPAGRTTRVDATLQPAENRR